MAGWRKRVDRKAESFTRNASLGPAADRLLKDLSQAANHGKLWLGVAGGLVLMGSRGRSLWLWRSRPVEGAGPRCP